MDVNYLTIQLSESAAHFISLQNNIVLHESSVLFQEDSTSHKRQILNDHFSSTIFLNKEFTEIILSWSFKSSTLVPNSIFSDSTPDAIFKLCFGKDSLKYDIDYNRISELSLINIYEIPLWIKKYFVMKFPKIIIQHEGSHIIRKNISENRLNLNAAIILYDGYFQLIIVKQNNLEFYSSFDYQNHEDIIYHLMFVLKQKKMININGVLEFIDGTRINNLIIEKLKTSLYRIKDFQKLKVSYPDYYIAKSQLLCV